MSTMKPEKVKADHGEGIVEVTFDTRKVDVPAMHDAIGRAGYHPRVSPNPGSS